MTTPRRAHLSATVVALTLSGDGTASTEQTVIPPGAFSAPDGRPASETAGKVKQWKNGPAQFKSTLDMAEAQGRPICVDYEHALVKKQPKGEKAIASGWVESVALSYDEQRGTLARIDWTPDAAKHIRDKEMKYLSPVFYFDDDGNVLGLHSIALTNNPALSQLTVAALSADMGRTSQPTTDDPPGDHMNLVALCIAAGIAATATEDQLMTHIADLTKRVNADPDPTKFVGMATLTAEQSAHAATREKLAALTTQVNTAVLDGYIKDATDAGAVLTAEYAADVKKIAARMGVDVAKRQLDALPRAAALANKQQTQGTPPKSAAAGGAGVVALTDSQRSMARLTGVTDEQYAAELAALTA